MSPSRTGSLTHQPESWCPQGHDSLTEFSLCQVGPNTSSGWPGTQQRPKKGEWGADEQSSGSSCTPLVVGLGLPPVWGHSSAGRAPAAQLLTCKLPELPPAGTPEELCSAAPSIPAWLSGQWPKGPFLEECFGWSRVLCSPSVTPLSQTAPLSAGSGLGGQDSGVIATSACPVPSAVSQVSVALSSSLFRACSCCLIVIYVAG